MFKALKRTLISIKFLVSLAISLAFLTSLVYGISFFYRLQHRDEPHYFGIIWAADSAEALGLDPVKDLESLAEDLAFNRLVLLSSWDRYETEHNIYDFQELDQLFSLADKYNLPVSLNLGLSQLNSLCQYPSWLDNLTAETAKLEYLEYLETIIQNYDQHDNLVGYHLEAGLNRDCWPEIASETDKTYRFVKTLTDKPVSLTRPDHQVRWSQPKPKPDKYGLNLDANSYRLPVIGLGVAKDKVPGIYYNFLAGMTLIRQNVNETYISDLAGRPAGLEDEAFSPDKLQQLLKRGRKTNLKTIDISGAEWWLYQERESGNRDYLKAVQQFLTNRYNFKQ